MFFFIPVGSEEGVRRLPYATIGLIVINTIIYFITSSMVAGQLADMQRINKELIEIETRYIYRIMETDPTILDEFDPDSLHARVERAEIIPVESDDYARWQDLYAQFKEERTNFVYDKLGFVPKRFDFFKIFSSLFIHAGFFHLFFNMLYLWLVGCNIEDDWSWPVFLGVYFISGIFAVLLHTAFYPNSTVPMIGASGAIAGIMGAFMIRHYKTKVRFAYFIWLIIARPYIGTVGIYAGVAFPLWLMIEIACAPGSGETGVAHYAHIGGFLFGVGVGVAMKYLGLEKKYVAPMVEDSFEKLKTTPKMREVNRKLNEGDMAAAIPMLLGIINDEPANFDAALMLARVYYEKGHKDDAAVMYNKAIARAMRAGEVSLVSTMHEEIKEKGIQTKLSEQNLYTCGSFMETHEKYETAAELFGLYIKLFPEGKVRPKALLRAYMIFKDKLHNENLASQSLAFLKEHYPDFPIPH
jgi:membrane associated rhomboid family serine protease